MSAEVAYRAGERGWRQQVRQRLKRRGWRRRARGIVLGAIPFLVLLAIWEANSRFGWLPPVLIPPLGDVVRAVGTLQSACPGVWAAIEGHHGCQMTNNVTDSLGRMILAAAVGIPLGVACGVLAGMSRTLSRLLEPIGLFANSISGIAWIPLAIVWFGIGWVTTLFIMLNTIFWLLFFNTMLGVRGISRVYEQSVLTMGGSRWHVIWQVFLPGSMPSIITGIRMSMGFGWRALIAAEMIGGNSGLGFMIFASAQEFKMEEVVLGVITIAMIWLATDKWVLEPLERWTTHRWGLVWTPH